MKIESNNEGNFVIKEVFSPLILETAEGNQVGVCMRDNTVEMTVAGTGKWYRANMATGDIEKMPVNKSPTMKEPHQQRVVDEKTELDDKIDKLKKFILLKPVFKNLSVAEQSWLHIQLYHMQQYSVVLGERINSFGR